MGTAKMETWKAKAKVSCQYRANIVPISVPIYIPNTLYRYWHGNIPGGRPKRRLRRRRSAVPVSAIRFR
jgi:hypothetical protein